jgi:ATP-dependent Clp protease, protease subunit
MIHQPSGGASGQATDIQIQAQEIQKLKNQLTGIYAKHSKQPAELLYEKMERDNFLSPEEAKQLGLIDLVLEHPPTAEEIEKAEKS